MWRYKEDNTRPVITAQAQIAAKGEREFPKMAVLFYMHSGIRYIQEHYRTVILTDVFPRFLNACPVYQIVDYPELCFLDGGRGAPQAVDTLEVLAAFGVKQVLSVGMFGAFDERVEIGDIIVPGKAFVEEGTSLHYYARIESAGPDPALHDMAARKLGGKTYPIVSTDAVYRQTFYKEALWREKGAVGVDMETSALFSVGRYLGVQVASALIASDKHPIREEAPEWQWRMTQEMRQDFFAKILETAFLLAGKK